MMTHTCQQSLLVICEVISRERLLLRSILFVYYLRKHNFTAWVSCSYKHTLDSSVQIFFRAIKRYILCVVPLPKTKIYSAGKSFNRDVNFQRHAFVPLIMRRREIKARVIRVSYLKMGGVVTDTDCQRASQSLYETVAASFRSYPIARATRGLAARA